MAVSVHGHVKGIIITILELILKGYLKTFSLCIAIYCKACHMFNC